MDFPVYRKFIDDSGFSRNGFPSKQFFKFLTANSTLNIRIDNVFAVGYAPEMPAHICERMLGMSGDWQECSKAEFDAAYQEANRQLMIYWDK